MTETKWTPGLYERSATTVYAANKEGKSRFSAFVGAGFEQTSARRGGAKRTTREECEATAQLFTAAPDLYEALEGMLRPWDRFSEFEMRRRVDEPRANEIIKARAALAKARGDAGRHALADDGGKRAREALDRLSGRVTVKAQSDNGENHG